MTCIVGLKGKFGTILGADTRASDAAGNFTDGILKVFNYNYGKQGIACCGSVKALNYVSTLDTLIDYKDILDEVDIDLTYVINNTAPVIQSIQQETKESGSSLFIFGTDKRLFTIYGDASVIEESKPFVSSGSNGDAARAVLEAGYHEDIELTEAIDLVITAIQAAGANNSTSNLDVNYTIIPTKEYEEKILEELDKQNEDEEAQDNKEDSDKILYEI